MFTFAHLDNSCVKWKLQKELGLNLPDSKFRMVCLKMVSDTVWRSDKYCIQSILMPLTRQLLPQWTKISAWCSPWILEMRLFSLFKALHLDTKVTEPLLSGQQNVFLLLITLYIQKKPLWFIYNFYCFICCVFMLLMSYCKARCNCGSEKCYINKADYYCVKPSLQKCSKLRKCSAM